VEPASEREWSMHLANVPKRKKKRKEESTIELTSGVPDHSVGVRLPRWLEIVKKPILDGLVPCHEHNGGN